LTGEARYVRAGLRRISEPAPAEARNVPPSLNGPAQIAKLCV